MPYTPVLATLGYVFSPDRRQVLLIRRDARLDDPHLGKYNGLGGKLESHEDIVTGMRREIREEAGIECQTLQLAGTVSWPGFGPNGQDWFGFIFRILEWSGTPLAANEEGSLSWIDLPDVLGLPLWEGDRQFLPIVFDLTAPPFHAVMPYAYGSPIGWTVHSLPVANSFPMQ